VREFLKNVLEGPIKAKKKKPGGKPRRRVWKKARTSVGKGGRYLSDTGKEFEARSCAGETGELRQHDGRKRKEKSKRSEESTMHRKRTSKTNQEKGWTRGEGVE